MTNRWEERFALLRNKKEGAAPSEPFWRPGETVADQERVLKALSTLRWIPRTLIVVDGFDTAAIDLALAILCSRAVIRVRQPLDVAYPSYIINTKG